MTKDPVCDKTNPESLSEALVVNPKNKGIKNIVIFVDKKSNIGESDIHPDMRAPRANPVVLDNNKCVFVPHILSARPKEVIEVKNSDATGHNANFNFFKNQAVNFVVPSNASKTLTLTDVEPAPIPVECNVHPWMRSYLVVVDHPYVGISDEDGVLKISNLPAGKALTLKIWHESMQKAIDEVSVNGKAESWKKGLFEVTLKPGMNDMGEVKIDGKKFK
jgi:plastocyanin